MHKSLSECSFELYFLSKMIPVKVDLVKEIGKYMRTNR